MDTSLPQADGDDGTVPYLNSVEQNEAIEKFQAMLSELTERVQKLERRTVV